jgi:Uma2 family endonuclease
MTMAQKQAARKTKKKLSAEVLDEGTPTWDIAYLFPAQGTWTEADYFELDHLPNTFPLPELSNGRLEILPMPTQIHQLIMLYLYEFLKSFVEVHVPGMVLVSAMKIKLGTGKFRQPDVLYMKAEHAHRRHNKYWEGADLVMEVVSGSRKDRKRDLEEKPVDYARAKIPEYWIIDPKERWIRVLTLRGRTYKLHGEFGPGTQATSVLLPGFAVSVDAVLAPPGSE